MRHQSKITQIPRVFYRIGKFISKRRESRLSICICRIAHPSVAVASGPEHIAASLRYDRHTLHVLK